MASTCVCTVSNATSKRSFWLNQAFGVGEIWRSLKYFSHFLRRGCAAPATREDAKVWDAYSCLSPLAMRTFKL